MNNSMPTDLMSWTKWGNTLKDTNYPNLYKEKNNLNSPMPIKLNKEFKISSKKENI